MRRLRFGFVIAIFAGLAGIPACGSDSSPTGIETGSPSAAGLAVKLPSAEFLVGDSIRAVARNGGGTDVSANVSAWAVSDPSVATVSATGMVVAIAPGTVAVSAHMSGQSASAVITVKAVTVAGLNVIVPAPATIGRQFLATAIPMDARKNILLGRTVSWSSANNRVATVSPGGLITPLAVGTTVITATSEGVTGQASLTVQAPNITAVAVIVGETALSFGTTTTAQAVVRDDANNLIDGQSVTWSSSDNSVATVSTSGVVTAFSPGTATVSATVKGVIGGATLVVHAPVVSVSVAIATNPIAIAKATTASAAVLDGSGNALPGHTVQWDSSNPAVASVSQDGVITAVSPGTTTISASNGNRTGTSVLTVQNGVGSVAVSIGAPQLKVGLKTNASATVRDAANAPMTGRAVSWTSTNTTVASVAADGTVTANAVGVSNILGTADGVSGSAAITVMPATTAPIATQLIVSAQPTSATSGTSLPSAVVVQVRDATGVTVPGATTVVSASVQSGGASLSGTTSVAAVNGVATFTNLQLIGSGAQTLRFTATGLASTTSNAISLAGVGSITVSLGTSPLAIAKTTMATATVLDAGGSVLSGHAVVWSSSNPAVATVAQDGTVTAVSAGTTNVSATSEGHTGTALLTVQSGVGSVAVSLGVTQVKVGVKTTASAIVRDATNVAITGRPIAWTSSNTAVASVAADGTVTGTGAGVANIVGTADGVSGSAGITVIPAASGVPSDLVITSQPSTATSGVTLSSAVTVQVRDALGVAVPGATNLVTAVVASGGGTLGGTTSVAAVNGVATFSNLQIAGAGTQTLAFSAAGLATANSSPIVVSGAAAAPSGEPVFSAATGTIVAQDNMDEYTTATAMGARNSTALIKPHQSPYVDGVNPATGADWPVLEPGQNSVVTGRGGVGKAIRLAFSGHYQDAASYVLQTNMIQTPPTSATHYFQYYGRINVLALGSLVGWPTAIRVKWFEAFHPDYGRIQWNTTDYGVGNHNKTFWGIHDQAFSEPLTSPSQPVGPYFFDLSDNQWHRYTYEYRSNTPNAGTVTINHTTLAATFSVSQAGVIHNGSILAFNTFYNGPQSPYVVSNFDGSTHATLTKLVPDNNAAPMAADINVQFSSSLDGVARMWIDGVKIIDVSQSAAGITPAGGEKVWCTLTDIATLAVGQTINYLWWGGTQTLETPPWTLDIDDLIWWTKP